MARLAHARRPLHRSDRGRHRADPTQSRQPAAHRHRLESGELRPDGAGAVPLRCFSSTSPTASCRASFTSARPMCFSACRSTSPLTRCSTMTVAQVCGLKPGEFVHSFGDSHLYLNHLDQARLQLTRQPRPLPTLTDESRGEGFVRADLRGFLARRVRSASAYQGRGRGVMSGRHYRCTGVDLRGQAASKRQITIGIGGGRRHPALVRFGRGMQLNAHS